MTEVDIIMWTMAGITGLQLANLWFSIETRERLARVEQKLADQTEVFSNEKNKAQAFEA